MGEIANILQEKAGLDPQQAQEARLERPSPEAVWAACWAWPRECSETSNATTIHSA
jgi:hypothetical protein